MAYNPGGSAWNPLILGAIAVIALLVAFLLFQGGLDSTQQAGIERVPPASTTPAPSQTPPAAPQTTPPGGTQ